MAFRVRATKTRLGDPQASDPTVFVNVECYDDTSNQVAAEGVLQYSLAGMAGMTSAQKRQRVSDDATAWGQSVVANVGAAAPILTLLGQSVVVG